MVQDNIENIEAEAVHCDSDESKHISLSIKTEGAKLAHTARTFEDVSTDQSHFSEKARRSGRFLIFCVVVAFLLIGRYSVPDDIIPCVEDKVFHALQFANDFINRAGNEFWRSFFQALCSLLVDITFIVTFIQWIFKGKSGRLPITLAIFYITRALIQKIMFMPYPQGWYWYDPGFPSLVVPYGRGSDFFFSGHTGFMVICASEWHVNKDSKHAKKVRNFVIAAGIYTMLTLVVYRIHYFIDVFTGFIFAEWVFCKVNTHKETLDRYFAIGLKKVLGVLGFKGPKLPIVEKELAALGSQE